jgi:hypothetical protein
MTAVRVVWTDAAHISAGEWVDDLGDTSVRVVTVGHLIRKTKTHVVVAHSKADGLWTGVFSIPLSAVKSIRKL